MRVDKFKLADVISLLWRQNHLNIQFDESGDRTFFYPPIERPDHVNQFYGQLIPELRTTFPIMKDIGMAFKSQISAQLLCPVIFVSSRVNITQLNAIRLWNRLK